MYPLDRGQGLRVMVLPMSRDDTGLQPSSVLTADEHSLLRQVHKVMIKINGSQDDADQ